MDNSQFKLMNMNEGRRQDMLVNELWMKVDKSQSKLMNRNKVG